MENKIITQSYVWTVAQGNLNVYQKRIMYRAIEAYQKFIYGEKLDKNFEINRNLFNDFTIKLPVSSFLTETSADNHSRIYQALKKLRETTIVFDFEDKKKGNYLQLVGLIEKPKYGYEKGFVEIEVTQAVIEKIFNFTHGHRKYEIENAFSLETEYSMRLYELFSNLMPVSYDFNYLKYILGLSNNYSRKHDFIKRIILPTQKELTEKCSISFNYTSKKGSNIINFTPYRVPENTDKKLERKELQKQVSPGMILGRQSTDYLRHSFDFTTAEIKQNLEIFTQASKKFDLIEFLSKVKPRANRANNPKGYVIASIKSQLKKI